MESLLSTPKIDRLLSVEETAEALGLEVHDSGRCWLLECYSREKYCKKMGIKPLPYYFKGTHRKYHAQDVAKFREQFKHDYA